MVTKSESRNRSYSRATDLMGRARQEATTSRLIAAGTVAAGAAAYAVLRDPARRERISQSARSYLDRANAWWNDSSWNRRTKTAPAASAANIPVL